MFLAHRDDSSSGPAVVLAVVVHSEVVVGIAAAAAFVGPVPYPVAESHHEGSVAVAAVVEVLLAHNSMDDPPTAAVVVAVGCRLSSAAAVAAEVDRIDSTCAVVATAVAGRLLPPGTCAATVPAAVDCRPEPSNVVVAVESLDDVPVRRDAFRRAPV